MQTAGSLAALSQPGHILMYVPRLSSLAAFLQLESYRVYGIVRVRNTFKRARHGGKKENLLAAEKRLAPA